MEILYKKVKENPDKIAKDCRSHILTDLNMDSIFKDRWTPFLEDLQNDLLGKPQETLNVSAK
jgi:hypothetical protein